MTPILNHNQQDKIHVHPPSQTIEFEFYTEFLKRAK